MEPAWTPAGSGILPVTGCRLQCARAYPTESQIAKAISDFGSWFALISASFPAYEPELDEPPADYRTQSERDHDRARQRRLWRSYGCSVVREVANAGWSPEAGYDLLAEDHKTVADVRAAVGNRDVTIEPRGYDRWRFRAEPLPWPA